MKRQRSIFLSLRYKLLLPFALIVIVVAFLMLPLTLNVIEGNLLVEADARLSQTATAFGRLLEATENEALLASSFIANLPDVETVGSDRVVAAQVFPPRKDELGLQEVSYYDATYEAGGTPIYYGGPPIVRRNQVSQSALDTRDRLILLAMESGVPVSGIALAPQGSQIIGAAPVIVDDEIQGAVLTAYFINESYIAEIGQILAVDAAIVRDNAVIAATIDPASGYELMLQEGLLVGIDPYKAETVVYGDGFDRRLLVQSLVLDGNFAGHILLAQEMQGLIDTQAQVLQAVYLFLAGLLVIIIIFAAGIIINFANPLRRLTEVAQNVSTGNFKEQVPVPRIWPEDEVVQLSRIFNSMTARLDDLYTGLERKVTERTRELSDTLAELAVKRDEALEANRTKSLFLANMSHELRTPLNAIIGYSEMLEEEAEDFGYEDIIPDLRKIQTAGKHLLNLINDILDIAKIEAGKVELHLENFKLDTVISDMIVTIQPMIDEKQNKLVYEAEDELGTVYADETKLRQVIINLLSNAAKFTEEGQITLTARRYIDSGIEWFEVAVSDTGIGMNEQQLAAVFQEFVQADTSTTKKYGGTGLGLPISRHFCQMMGGDIIVASEEGVGSTFTIQIPAQVTAKTAQGEAEPVLVDTYARSSMESPESLAKVRVLIIDDDPNVHDLLSRSLTREGFEVFIAESGEEGLQRTREVRPHVITLDVMMKGTDGWRVLSELKTDPQLSHIPVVMLSMLDNKSLGFALGAADYLVKPVERNTLVEVLTRYGTMSDSVIQHVLVVEDDDYTRELLRRTAEREGWSATEAENGRVGLRRLIERKPTLILLDLMMPEMDGFTFITELRADERWKDIPVVVVTAKTLTDDDRRQLNGHVERILQKGQYTTNNLIAEIRGVLDVRKKG